MVMSLVVMKFPDYHGMNDPGAVALECRNYIEDRVVASQWGDNPISTYVPEGLTMAQHEIIAQQGFVIHGDLTGLHYTAWHDNKMRQMICGIGTIWGVEGGSLEQIIWFSI